MATLLCFASLLAVHLEDGGGGGNIPFDPVEHGDDDGNAAFDFNEHDDDDE